MNTFSLPLRPLSSARRAGFTLLEIMLVVMIIALLLSSAIFLIRGNLESAEITRVDGDLQSIEGQLKLYQSINGFFPTTSQGLKALVERPTSEPKPKRWRELLSRVPQDPWHLDYIYLQPGKKNPNSFDLYSKGPDKVDGTEDDMGNWDTP